MKNRIFSIMDMTKKKTGVLMLCVVLAGMGTTKVVFTANKPTGGSEKQSANTAYAVEGGSTQQGMEQTAKQYAAYVRYGLLYDRGKDSFSYKGKLVIFFVDVLDRSGRCNFFTRPNGSIGLRAVRNKKNELTGLAPISKKECEKLMGVTSDSNSQEEGQKSTHYDANSCAYSSEGDTKANDSTADSASVAYQYGSDSNSAANSLKAYLRYGVSYNKAKEQWIFNNKPVHFLIDGKNKIYVDNSSNAVKDGVSLKVIRKANGNIIELKKITAKEAASLIKVEGMK